MSVEQQDLIFDQVNQVNQMQGCDLDNDNYNSQIDPNFIQNHPYFLFLNKKFHSDHQHEEKSIKSQFENQYFEVNYQEYSSKESNGSQNNLSLQSHLLYNYNGDSNNIDMIKNMENKNKNNKKISHLKNQVKCKQHTQSLTEQKDCQSIKIKTNDLKKSFDDKSIKNHKLIQQRKKLPTNIDFNFPQAMKPNENPLYYFKYLDLYKKLDVYKRLNKISSKQNKEFSVQLSQNGWYLDNQGIPICFEQFWKYCWKFIQYLNASNTQLKQKDWNQFVKRGDNFPDLKVLRVDSNKIGDINLQDLKSFKNLQLIISGVRKQINKLQQEQYERVQRQIKSLGKLKEVCYEFNKCSRSLNKEMNDKRIFEMEEYVMIEEKIIQQVNRVQVNK